MVRILPCQHLIHVGCAQANGLELDGMPCPYCGELIEEQQPIIRKTYKKHTPEDRARIIAAAGNGECWVALSKVLGIPRNTAEDWVNSNLERPLPKGGNRKSVVTQAIADRLIMFLEEDPQLTLKQLGARTQAEFGITVSEATISRKLHCMAFTVKKVHAMPCNMNSTANLLKRMEYVETLQRYMEDGE